ncbi:hypothetical protein AALP_AAs67670U000100 [Arabis alpina]|uniref:Uncharacterized protein n=1 Tax=Arabis alpina TaxID=50452 RepID=A0A087FWU1_ARAAL|nr:hypothetical protein AALP_AAs67670U000100 [Arabis alpina]
MVFSSLGSSSQPLLFLRSLLGLSFLKQARGFQFLSKRHCFNGSISRLSFFKQPRGFRFLAKRI